MTAPGQPAFDSDSKLLGSGRKGDRSASKSWSKRPSTTSPGPDSRANQRQHARSHLFQCCFQHQLWAFAQKQLNARGLQSHSRFVKRHVPSQVWVNCFVRRFFQRKTPDQTCPLRLSWQRIERFELFGPQHLRGDAERLTSAAFEVDADRPVRRIAYQCERQVILMRNRNRNRKPRCSYHGLTPSITQQRALPTGQSPRQPPSGEFDLPSSSERCRMGSFFWPQRLEHLSRNRIEPIRQVHRRQCAKHTRSHKRSGERRRHESVIAQETACGPRSSRVMVREVWTS